MLGNLVTPRVLRWLRDGRTAQLLHRFDELVNLVSDRGELITVATQAVGPGPFTMIVDGDFQSHFAEGKLIEIDSQQQKVISGHLVIDVQQASIWQPQPAWSRLREISLDDLLPAAPLSKEIEGYLHQLLQGLVQGDEAKCQAGSYGLAGRGIGLTPTGDDVLMGVLYGLWVWDPRRELIDMIVNTAVPRTTTLSAAFLQAAAAGEATFHWHELVNGQLNAATQILSIGHSSGADAWAGFVHTSKMLAH